MGWLPPSGPFSGAGFQWLWVRLWCWFIDVMQCPHACAFESMYMGACMYVHKQSSRYRADVYHLARVSHNVFTKGA